MLDPLLRDVRIPPPLKGMWDGLDPALLDDEYPANASPDLENIRVLAGKWETRLGMVSWKTLPGAGAVRLLDNVYTSSGQRFRLAARGDNAGAVLYDYLEGTDTTFQSTSGGTGLGTTTSTQPYFQGVMLGDRYYFTDRFGALRKYQRTPPSGNEVQTVAQPVAPTSPPFAYPSSYAVFEKWSSVAAWSPSDVTKLEIVIDAANPAPGPFYSNCAHVHPIANTLNQTITRSGALSVPSNQIGFWYQSDDTVYRTMFSAGVASPTEIHAPMTPLIAKYWTHFFLDIGAVQSLNYLRFTNISTPDASVRVGPMVLPGRLLGQYRWCYTHYDPATGRESPPSAVSNGGQPMNFEAIGQTNNPNVRGDPWSKSCWMSFTSDSGVDATTTRIRIYRNGGVPSLTKDSRGRDVWLRVGEVYDQKTTLTANLNPGDASFTVTSATNISVGDYLGLTIGGGNVPEVVRVTGVAGTTISFDTPIFRTHVAAETVAIAFCDNTANETIDVTQPIDIERNDPPAAAKWIARDQAGRLWIFNYTGKPTGVAVSNRATPDHPTDYEVFPDAVDPLTRRSLSQGWRFQIGGDTTDDEIVWGGMFHGVPTVITRRHLYQIHAMSQAEWGPFSIQKVASVGCIAGDTVQEVNGTLYWASDGPHVVRWAGPGQAPEILDYPRVSTTLNNAPSASWFQWFARYHAKRDGHYYCLYLTPSGQTTNTLRLDYNVSTDAWEPVVYYDGSGVRRAWQQAAVREGGGDFKDLYQASAAGVIYQTETGLTDDGTAIKIRMTTKRVPLLLVSLLKELFVRLAGLSADTVTFAVTSGGSEYGDVTKSYAKSLAGSGDLELKIPLEKTLLGRWAQIQITGDVSNRPALREMVLRFVVTREGRYSA